MTRNTLSRNKFVKTKREEAVLILTQPPICYACLIQFTIIEKLQQQQGGGVYMWPILYARDLFCLKNYNLK